MQSSHRELRFVYLLHSSRRLQGCCLPRALVEVQQTLRPWGVRRNGIFLATDNITGSLIVLIFSRPNWVHRWPIEAIRLGAHLSDSIKDVVLLRRQGFLENKNYCVSFFLHRDISLESWDFVFGVKFNPNIFRVGWLLVIDSTNVTKGLISTCEKKGFI